MATQKQVRLRSHPRRIHPDLGGNTLLEHVKWFDEKAVPCTIFVSEDEITSGALPSDWGCWGSTLSNSTTSVFGGYRFGKKNWVGTHQSDPRNHTAVGWNA